MEQKNPDAVRRNRSNAMVTLGVVLLVVAGFIRLSNSDYGSTGVLLFGLFGAGLIVGGLVIRP